MAELLVEHPPHADGQTALLYERHGTRIYRFCLARLRSREEAEDAVQSTFLRAHGALRQGVVPHSETAWLFKIAQNVCVTRAVASSRRMQLEHAADLDQVNERIPSNHRQHDELIGLADALAEMPPNLRRAFLLREWKGLSYAEIATELGVSQSAVETLIFRARRHLAGALEVPTSRLRRALRALNLGPLADFIRGLFAAGGAKVAAVAAVVAVGSVGVTVVPGSNSRSPGAPANSPGATGVVPQANAGDQGTGATSRSQPNTRAGTTPQTTSGPAGAVRASGARQSGTSSPGAPTAGITPTAEFPAGAAPSGSLSPAAPSGSSGASGTSGSSGAPLPPVVGVPQVPVTSGSSGLPEIPSLPPVPELPIPEVPSVPAVPVPEVPSVPAPTVPPLPSLSPPPVPVTPPGVPPVPSVPPLPEPPPVPQVLPPPPPPPPLPLLP